MFRFGGQRRKADGKAEATGNGGATAHPVDEAGGSPLSRLQARLGGTGRLLGGGLQALLGGGKAIDEGLLDETETLLLSADVGLPATERIIATLRKRLNRKQLTNPQAFLAALRQELLSILAPCEGALPTPDDHGPLVVVMVGVNGVGKTTTIGKLARRFKDGGLKVMLAAGDTFRAAAVEQLRTWGERHDVAVVSQGSGADSASVVFDALQSAKAKKADVLIADTAGRLHNKDNLMNELEKILRVLRKQDEHLRLETLLVLDATTGQNAVAQAKAFHQAIGVTGLVLTKLDGSARGGVLFSLAAELGLPVRFIGIGERAEDLRPFQAAEFVAALLASPPSDNAAVAESR